MKKPGECTWDDWLQEDGDVKRLAVNDLHNDLLLASVEIGGIYDMEYWSSEGIATRVHNTGKQVRDITVGEILDMLGDQRAMHATVERLHNKWRAGS